MRKVIVIVWAASCCVLLSAPVLKAQCGMLLLPAAGSQVRPRDTLLISWRSNNCMDSGARAMLWNPKSGTWTALREVPHSQHDCKIETVLPEDLEPGAYRIKVESQDGSTRLFSDAFFFVLASVEHVDDALLPDPDISESMEMNTVSAQALLSPNPVVEHMSVRCTVSDIVRIEVFDLVGRMLFSVILEMGNDEIALPADIRQGAYIVRVLFQNGTFVSQRLDVIR